jgi:hypothetical protein
MKVGTIAVAGIALVTGLAGCSPQSSGNRSAPSVPPVRTATADESITYSSGACFGVCPIYSVTVTPTGGTFHGQEFTAVKGDRRFPLTPAQYQAFAASLAPYRPQGERLIANGQADCGPAHTDDITAEVRWGGKDRLALYFGCENPALRSMKTALDGASGLLPIAGLIGKR